MPPQTLPTENAPILWEALAPKQEELHGCGPYAEGTLMRLPLPIAASFATSMIGHQGTVQDMIYFANELNRILPKPPEPLTLGEILHANILGKNEDLYSITQVMQNPVDIETGRLLNPNGTQFTAPAF